MNTTGKTITLFGTEHQVSEDHPGTEKLSSRNGK